MTLPREVRIALPGWVDEVLGVDRRYGSDEEAMAVAVRLAGQNVEREAGGGPFGALVIRQDTGALVAAGVNSVIRLGNSALHAEVVALMLAHTALGVHSFGLPGVPPMTLVTSCEPCIMCLGATAWSGARRLVCGAVKADAEALGFDEGPVTAASYAQLEARGVAIRRGVLRDDARGVLARYRELGRPIY